MPSRTCCGVVLLVRKTLFPPAADLLQGAASIYNSPKRARYGRRSCRGDRTSLRRSASIGPSESGSARAQLAIQEHAYDPDASRVAAAQRIGCSPTRELAGAIHSAQPCRWPRSPLWPPGITTSGSCYVGSASRPSQPRHRLVGAGAVSSKASNGARN